MREEIGIGTVSLGSMGQLHSRDYRRMFDYCPECEATRQLVIAAAVEGSAEGAGA